MTSGGKTLIALLAVLLAFYTVLPASLWAQPAGGEASQAMVSLDGVDLFRLRGTETFPAEERARMVRSRIVGLARDPGFRTDALEIVESEHSTDIKARGQHIVSILDADAALEDLRRQEVAQAVTFRIRQAVERYRVDHSRENLTRGALYAAAATGIAAVSLFLVLWILGGVARSIERRYKTSTKNLKVGSFDVVHAGRIWQMIRTLLQVARLAVILTALYVYLQFTLSLFPGTRAMAGRLANLVLDPLAAMTLAFIDYLPSLAFLIVLVVLVSYALKMVRYFFLKIEYGRLTLEGFEAEWARPTYKLVRTAVIAFAAVVAYPYIPGSGSEAFKGISIFIGILISLGSSSAISNVIAGYTMVYRRTFKLGDVVRIDTFIGKVDEMRLLATHLRTIKNEVIVVPNSLILSSSVVNYSRLAKTDGLILHTSVGIGYEAPWRQVEAMLKIAADRTSGLKKEPPPFVRQDSLGDFAVQYEINAYCDDPLRMSTIYAELHRNILDLFNEHGVQIMTPAYEGDPDARKTVPKDQWYAAPAKPPEDKPADGGPKS